MMKVVSYMTIALLVVTQQVLGAVNYTAGVQATCFNARNERNNNYCVEADWLSATMYSRANYTLYETNDALSREDQDGYAVFVREQLLAGAVGSTSSANQGLCRGAVKRLSCVTAFPGCPEKGESISSVSYYEPCKLLCIQINAQCDFNIDCDAYPAEDCMITVPAGYFVLDPAQGPYGPIPAMYYVVLTLWVLMSVYWIYATYYWHKNKCAMLCRVVAFIPIMKTVVLAFGAAFWTTCDNLAMCSFWMGVTLINTHLVFETGSIIVFILVAKGYSITRDNLNPNEWRLIIIGMAAFYMASSIILVLEASVLTTSDFWIACAVIYGLVYLQIFSSVQVEISKIQDHCRCVCARVCRMYMYTCVCLYIYIYVHTYVCLYTCCCRYAYL